MTRVPPNHPAVLTIGLFASALVLIAAGAAASQKDAHAPDAVVEYRVLATSRTSTMEKELNDAAAAGFRFTAVMGGETAFGGNEVVVVMMRSEGAEASRYAYRLLATSRTSTMQKELQEAADAGFDYRGQTVFKSRFGGDEVVSILEHDRQEVGVRWQYRLLATSRTSTLQRELLEAGAQGYEVLGMTVGTTTVGGKELVAITRRPGDR